MTSILPDTPDMILETWISTGVKKAKLPWWKMILLGVLAGIYIGFGAHVFVNASAVGKITFESMLSKLVGAAMFPVGLMLVVLCGGELFTGNNLLTLALFDKKIKAHELLKNWIFVFFGNLVGSVLLSALLAKSGLYTGDGLEKAIVIAQAKTILPAEQLIIRGVLCNILVVLACWLQAAAKDMISKIFAIWFPITLFVFAEFEHSVANMTYIPLGIFLGADVSWSRFFLSNLLPVTIGNLVGGAVVIPAIYYISYKTKKVRKSHTKR